MGFSFFKKRSRPDLIEAAATKAVSFIVKDSADFTPTEQAKIATRINNIFVERFSNIYDDAYANQQTVLEAKELIK